MAHGNKGLEEGSTKDGRWHFLRFERAVLVWVHMRPIVVGPKSNQAPPGKIIRTEPITIKIKIKMKLVQLDYTLTHLLYIVGSGMAFIVCNLEICDVSWVPIKAWKYYKHCISFFNF